MHYDGRRKWGLALTFTLIAVLLLAGGCGKEQENRRIVIMDNTAQRTRLTLYMEAGGLGGMSAEVNVGEYATVLEQIDVGPEVVGAIAGSWVRLNTLYDPREGWLEETNTRPAPAD